MINISVVVSAHNEEKYLGKCLASVSWADEIIVVDCMSTDRTSEIAKHYKAKVFNRPNQLMLNLNKNYGFSKASGKWILNLDGDEEIDDVLAGEIKKAISNGLHNGYWMDRKNYIFGKWITGGIWNPDKHLRLFKKNHGSFPCLKIHEYIKVDGSTSNLKGYIIHHNIDSVSEYLRTIDRCTTSEADEYVNSGFVYYWHDIVKFAASDFIKIYLAQKGYKDGLHGLSLAIFQAFYSFILFTKIWEKNKFRETSVGIRETEKKFKESCQEFAYWRSSEILATSNNLIEKIIHKFRRKFRI